MKNFIVLLGLLLSPVICAQNLEEIQLGVIRGELGEYQGKLVWVNQNQENLSGKIWTDKNWMSLSDSVFTISKGDTLMINYTIDISEAIGLSQAEIRLLDSEGIILDGFLIQGRFLPTDTLALDSYRNEFFPFKAKEQVFNMGVGFNNQQFSRTFTLYNFGGDSLDLTQITSTEAHIKFLFSPSKIAHNQFTQMEIVYMPDLRGKRGFTRENLSLYDVNKNLIAVLPVQYTLEDNLERVTGAAPRLSLSKLNHDFRVMKTGTLKEVTIKLSNTGNTDLSFYKIESNCECLTYSLKDKVLSPGQSSELVVQFNAENRLGLERKTLAIFSNDPNQSTKVLVFKAHVK